MRVLRADTHTAARLFRAEGGAHPPTPTATAVAARPLPPAPTSADGRRPASLLRPVQRADPALRALVRQPVAFVGGLVAGGCDVGGDARRRRRRRRHRRAARAVLCVCVRAREEIS